MLANVVLPSLYSYPPPKIVLEVEGTWEQRVDYQAWKVMVGHLRRAAKQFTEATHPERKMEVGTSVTHWDNDDDQSMFVWWCTRGGVMLKLKEHANLVVTDEGIR